MAITDPEALRFINEQIRPLCESTRALKVRMSAMKTMWDDHIGALIPSDTSAVEDGRESEGVSRLTGLDVNNVRNAMAVLITSIGDTVIGKPCVRPLEVSGG